MINYNAPVNWTGYGGVGLEVLRCLLKKYPDSPFFPIGEVSTDCTIDKETCDRGQANIEHHYESRNPSLRLWHEFDLFPRYGSPAFGFTFFETDHLSPRAISGLRSLDGVFVASNWAKKVLISHAIDEEKVHVCKLGVSEEFVPKLRRNRGTYRFFNIGKLEVRKGHDILCELFNRAFEETDDVELYIKWNNPFIDPKIQRNFETQYKKSKMGDKIHFLKTSSRKEVAELIRFCDCGIFPSRAEGFGLPILESIACNKHVITTNYSAMADFCNQNNSSLVNINGLEPAIDNMWFHGQGQWAHLGEHEKDQFIAHMCHAYENDKRENPGSQATLLEYNWQDCTDKMFDICRKGVQTML